MTTPPAGDRLEPTRTGKASSRATIPQEFFYSMAAHDPDSSAYYQTAAFVIEGPLEHARLAHVLASLVASHEVFRTVFRDEGGVLHQVVLPLADAPPFELELADRSAVAADPDTWNAEIRRTLEELVGRGFDLVRGRLLWARLVKLAPERHAFVVVFHHVVIDAASTFTFFRRLFTTYADRSVDTVEPPALQYVDVAEAFARFATTPTGEAQAAYWREHVKGAQPVSLPVDLPREPVDARRSAGRRGVATDPMHPVQYATLPAELREAITRVARKQRVTIYGVYAAALFWLLHQETGQTDLCIETTSDLRSGHAAFEDVQGILVVWTLLRADLAGCTSFHDVLPRAGRAVAEAKRNGLIADYYGLVPHPLRRVVFNYVPLRWFEPEPRTYPGLHIEQRRQAFPRWKRPWDLHLTLLDGDNAVIAWTGNENLFRRETVVALLTKYLAILDAGARI